MIVILSIITCNKKRPYLCFGGNDTRIDTFAHTSPCDARVYNLYPRRDAFFVGAAAWATRTFVYRHSQPTLHGFDDRVSVQCSFTLAHHSF